MTKEEWFQRIHDLIKLHYPEAKETPIVVKWPAIYLRQSINDNQLNNAIIVFCEHLKACGRNNQKILEPMQGTGIEVSFGLIDGKNYSIVLGFNNQIMESEFTLSFIHGEK